MRVLEAELIVNLSRMFCSCVLSDIPSLEIRLIRATEIPTFIVAGHETTRFFHHLFHHPAFADSRSNKSP